MKSVETPPVSTHWSRNVPSGSNTWIRGDYGSVGTRRVSSSAVRCCEPRSTSPSEANGEPGGKPEVADVAKVKVGGSFQRPSDRSAVVKRYLSANARVEPEDDSPARLQGQARRRQFVVERQNLIGFDVCCTCLVASSAHKELGDPLCQ